ncbi:MAG: transglutaminase domain-containing protein, partial [Candidatus Bilamarchaeaceae archaeon]
MRGAILFLAFFSLSFSAYVGEAVLQIEKTWRISSNGTITDVWLNGTFLAVNDFQEIRQMSVREGARFEQAGNEIYVIFEAPELSGERNITAVAVVHTAYPLRITSNPPFQGIPPQLAGGLISYDEGIAASARQISLGKGEQLEVVAALSNWVNRYVSYDLSKWGDPAPATKVFSSPAAVCVGYSHLFISMARSLGFETRFVSGYAFAGDWQPHAWAEVKIGEEWVPVDPTFNEMGILDARHIAAAYSNDQGEVYDTMTAKGADFAFSTSISFGTSEQRAFQNFLSPHTVLFGDGLEVIIFNPTDFYATPTYSLDMPDYILPDDSRIIVIPPHSSIALRYTLNTAELEP